MADLLKALQRRPKSLVIAFTAIVLGAVATHQVAELHWRREQALDAARARAANLAFVVADHVRASFAVTDTSLRQLAVHARRVGGARATPDAWNAILAASREALPDSGSITVTDEDGRIRFSTQPAIVGESRRAQYIFERLSTASRDELVVDTPFLTPREPRRYVIPLGRPLLLADGRFGGMVVATVVPETYRDFFRTIDVGHEGVLWVFHPDGVVLFREPSDADPIGGPAGSNAVLRAAVRGGGAGVLEGPLERDGAEFISAFQVLRSPRLVAAVSLHRGEVLAEWRRQRQTSALAFGVLALTLGGVVLVLFRQIDVRARVEAQLREVQRLEAERLREANERLADALDREQRARRDAETASYLKDEFLMTVSHELRTPLTAIFGWVRMLGMQAVRPEEAARALSALERNVRAQTRLIDDLLDVSRAISGKLRIEPHPVSVPDVVGGAIETVRPALEAKTIRLVTDFDPGLEPILADAERLQQIVWNLLSNAIKFTPDGGTIEIRANRMFASVEIAVRDTGAGIAPEFLPYVFERFRQEDTGTQRRYGGLGLGLAIVRHLVELHGGTVTAESPGLGRGATFKVLLPSRTLAAADAPDGALRQPEFEPLEVARLEGVRVLVVDDEPDARDLFLSVLDAAGAVVHTASSAASAREVLARETIDVIVSDIEMPYEDGYQFLQRAMTDPAIQARRPVSVAVTAHARAVDRRHALEAGYDSHLGKPVDPAQLVNVIARLVQARHGRTAG